MDTNGHRDLPPPDQSLGSCDPGGLPEDLRQWLPERELVCLVLGSLHLQSPDSEGRSTPLPAGETRILLTLLTYSYAVGLYGSDDIERSMRESGSLRYLAARTLPASCSLRQFRRQHRRLLERSLARLLFRAGASALSEAPRIVAREWLRMCQHAAAWRVQQAVVADAMALDY